jgi:hypothetical protein
MYPSHITDRPEVLPFNRNNCRGGSAENCMYYNDDGKAHYNYTAVQGTGDHNSVYYKSNFVAQDGYNDEHLYEDHAIGNLGGYNDPNDYGDINNKKGFYGPAVVPSYPQVGPGNHFSNANVHSEMQDYDTWDRYHRYHNSHFVNNSSLVDSLFAGRNPIHIILLAALVAGLYMNRQSLVGLKDTHIGGGIVLLFVLFFLSRISN